MVFECNPLICELHLASVMKQILLYIMSEVLSELLIKVAGWF